MRKLYREMRLHFRDHIAESVHGPFWVRLRYNWNRALRRLLPLGGMSGGNRIEIIAEGDAIFQSMMDAIAVADTSVWLETYIFESDRLGVRVRDALVAAARRGCSVILLFDYFGSPRMTNGFLAPLRQSGGRAISFNPIWPWRRRGPLLFRDHRKILVVDQKIGFCGGMNISADYAGSKLGTARFRDTMVRVEGPAVSDLAAMFCDSFGETTGEELDISYDTERLIDGLFLQVLGSNTRRNLRAIQRGMEVTLERATHYCYLTTPYFLPYEPLRQAMLKAAARGVDVRVLTAGLSDIPLMRMASQRVYGQFLEAGIRIYEMFGKTLHAKTATIDGIYGSVGSFNLDHWSARRLLEVTVNAFDHKIAKQLEDQFQTDLELSKEVTIESWRNRSWMSSSLHWLAYQLMRL